MKDVLKKKFSDNYKRYYEVELFRKEGFQRKKCSGCNNYFWTLDSERMHCPNPPCEKYGFIGNSPTKPMDYIETWKLIENFFVKNGHISVPSYPVVCRWFPGLYFTIASIVAFQRCVQGKTVFELPSNPLIIPQQCLRFNDIPNVGVTGRHMTNFVMIGQHSIYDGKNGYWSDRCIELDYKLLRDVFKIKNEEIIFVEDVWVGPNAFGYSLEYFVRGLELGNAVFTEFVGTPEKYTTMTNKVIDMGAGLERFAWITQGTPTAYDAVYASALKKLMKYVDYDKNLFMNYSKLAGDLDFDEGDTQKVKSGIARTLGMDIEELNCVIKPVEAIYAIADHAKTLLYAISDGSLPSNVGGGYNLRIILRRALSFIDEFDFDLNLFDVCKWHYDYLKRFSPRLEGCLEDVKKVLYYEKKRFYETKKRNIKLIETIGLEKIGIKKLIELYESHGITPEQIEDYAQKKNVSITIPTDFYQKISDMHMSEKSHDEERMDVSSLLPTKILYYDRLLDEDFDARVMKIDKNNVVLDQTLFYPESGGQDHDTGTINSCTVFDVQKFGNVVVHRLENINFKEGDIIHGVIDRKRRDQLMWHHTAIHIINGAARKILGNHVWQAGARKTVEKAHIDITHFKSLTHDEILEIERIANNVIKKELPVMKHLIDRILAERKYGIRIYQGGVVPEKILRILEISDDETFDIEACGGTHCDNTGWIGRILITSSERIQDGVVRINIVAGNRAVEYLKEKGALLSEIESILDTKGKYTIKAAENIFNEWKKLKKKLDKKSEKKALSFKSKLKALNGVVIEKLPVKIDELRKLSRNMKRVVLFGTVDKSVVVVSDNARNILKQLLDEIGGKGGGSSSFAQGFYEKEPDIKKVREIVSK